MRAIREILRQRYEFERSIRDISRSTGISYGTVQAVLQRARQQGLAWPLPDGLGDDDLDGLLFKSANPTPSRPLPDMEAVDRELRHKGVTLWLVWQEYKTKEPGGYQYTQFCRLYKRWKAKQDPVMRQSHTFGHRAFSDFAGSSIPYTDPGTGEIRQAQVFITVLGASAYISAHVFPAQDLRAWVLGTCMAFEDFGGVPRTITPDNPKAVVLQADRYEPVINPTYLDMATHYGTVVEPARPGKPRDKAPAETAVQLVERWVIAPLRHRRFFSLDEVESSVQSLLAELNRRPFQKREGNRLTLLTKFERPLLRPLPANRYDFAFWKKAKVNIDYHVEVEKGCLYSVPYRLIHEKVDVRLGSTTVAIYHHGRQVALHPRIARPGSPVTNPEHMASSHRRYAEWTPSRIIRWASETGPKTAELVESILKARPHPEMGYRSCLGIIRLGSRYGRDRLEAACARALGIRALSYTSVRSILEKGLDRLPLPFSEPLVPPVLHENLRGAAYFSRRIQ